MWDTRLLLLVGSCLALVSGARKVLEEHEIDVEIQNHDNILIGYFGYEHAKCEYKNEFASHMETVAKKLEGRKFGNKTVAVAVTPAPYKYTAKNHASPVAVLYQKPYKPYPITYTNDGLRIVNWVEKKLLLPTVYTLKSRAEYEGFGKQFRLTFAAYLPTANEQSAYRKVAHEYDYPFFLVENSTDAQAILNLEQPSIVADKHGSPEIRETYNTYLEYEDSIRTWVHEQIKTHVLELKHMEDAASAFSSETNHIAILFVSKSNPDYKQLITKFEEISSEKVRLECLTIFYADIDSDKNSKLMQLLEVPAKTAIALISHPFNIHENPITKRCAQSKNTLAGQKRVFYTENYFKDYETDVSTSVKC